MSKVNKDPKKLNFAVLSFAINSVITDLVAKSLDNIINRNEGSVSSFLKAHFKFWLDDWESENTYLENANSVLIKYYEDNNRTYPNSLVEANIDITNLLAIRTNLMKARSDPEGFFKTIKTIRNICFHSKYISEVDYIMFCQDLRQVVDKCPHINKDERLTYLKDLNYIIENLVIDDRQFKNRNQNMDNVISQINQDVEMKLKFIENKFEHKFNSIEQQMKSIKDENIFRDKRLRSVEVEANKNAQQIGIIKRAIPLKVFDFATGGLMDVNAYKQSKSGSNYYRK